MSITVHMLIASKNKSGNLFKILNNPKKPFNITFALFALIRLGTKPENTLTTNFLLMMKEYL